MDVDPTKLIIDIICVVVVTLGFLLQLLLLEPFKRGFFCDDETIRYPYRPSSVPDYTLYVVGLGLNIVVMVAVEVSQAIKSKDQPEISLLGLRIPPWLFRCLKVLGVFWFGAACNQVITDIGKYTIGRLRPHFYDVCKPDVECTDARYANRYIEFHKYTCTGTDKKLLKEMRLSFPSGHSSFSAYTMVYLSIYVQAKLNWQGSALLKHVLQIIFISMSWATGLSRISDNKHHWSDVLTGFIVGAVSAFMNAYLVSDLMNGAPASSEDVPLL